VDPDALERALTDAFDPAPAELRVVVRAASDLDDDGVYEDDAGRALTPGLVVAELADAPDERLPERWNWWLGALELAYASGYDAFGVRAVER
jgi:hypothetical protein